MSSNEQRYYSADAAAKLIGISVTTVRRLILAGEIPATPWGGSVKIPKEQLDALLAAKDEEALKIALERRQAKTAKPPRPVGRPRLARKPDTAPKRPVGRPRKDKAAHAEEHGSVPVVEQGHGE